MQTCKKKIVGILQMCDILCFSCIILIWTLLINYLKTQLRMMNREKVLLKLIPFFGGNLYNYVSISLSLSLSVHLFLKEPVTDTLNHSTNIF